MVAESFAIVEYISSSADNSSLNLLRITWIWFESSYFFPQWTKVQIFFSIFVHLEMVKKFSVFCMIYLNEYAKRMINHISFVNSVFHLDLYVNFESNFQWKILSNQSGIPLFLLTRLDNSRFFLKYFLILIFAYLYFLNRFLFRIAKIVHTCFD